MSKERHTYLLLWKHGLHHGCFKAVSAVCLGLLPQSSEKLYRVTLYGQGLRKQALKGH